MTEHFTTEQLNSYLHQTLTDAEREAMDRHLTDCLACRTRLDGHEALQRRLHYEFLADLRGVQPSSRMSYAAIAPRLKRSRRLTMVLKQSNQFVYGALTMALLVVVGVGLYFFVSNLSRPTPTTPEEDKQPTLPTVISQPEVKATVEVSQPVVDLSSIGAMFRGNPQHTGVYGDADIKGPELGEVKWQFKIGGSSTQSSPAVVNGLVYIGSFDKHIYAIDAETGQEKWKFETGSPVWSSPAVVEGVLYIGSNDHYLYALDRQTGQEKWKFETGAAVRSSPAVADDVVYVGSFDKNVYALDAQTGQEQWRFETEASIYSSPTVAAGVLYIGSGCDRADGCEGSRPYYLYALDSQTGQEKWRFEAGSTIESSPAVVAGLVYFGSIDGYLYAVDSQTGQEKWKFKTIDSVVSSPGVAAGVVYIGENNGYLYALDSQTGQEKWQFKVKDSLYTSPVVVAGVVYIGGADFNLYALDSQNGREKWKFATRNSVQSSPTVADGVVYIGSDDGYLYAVQ